MTRPVRLCALCLLPLLLVCIAAAHARADETNPYAGHHVVRVEPSTVKQMRTVLALTDVLWSERYGVGAFDVQLAPEKLALLDQQGIDYTVLVKDVGANIVAERAEIDRLRALRGTGWFDTYREFSEMITFAEDLAANHAHVSKSSVGTSIEGRDIFELRITGSGDSSQRPQIFFMGCQHAREWVSPATVFYIADQLAQGYGSDPRITALLNTVEFIIVPVVNPDGYVYSWQSAGTRLWRKNRRNNGNGTFGVDLNRNWAYEWGGVGSSGSTNSDTYRGTAPFSEPETDAMKAIIENNPRIVAHIDFHAYSQLVLWPWGFDDSITLPEPELSLYVNLGVAMTDAIFDVNGRSYDPIQAADLYEASGDSSDWVWGDQNVYSYTFELRDDDTGPYGFQLPPEQILPTGQENMQAALLFAEFFSEPMRLVFPDGEPTGAQADGSTLLRVQVQEIFGDYAPGTATLHYRSAGGGSFASVPMSDVGGLLAEAAIPAGVCGDTIEIFVSAQTTSGMTVSEPSDGAGSLLSVELLELTLSFEDELESGAVGWSVNPDGTDTATTGVWSVGDPEATDAQPEDDHTEAGTLCFFTDGRAGASLGTYDIDGGVTTLLSPALDATGDGDAYISYWRWYSNNTGGTPNADSMPIEISGDNGASWTTIETVTENANAWVYREYRVADYVAPSDQVRLRFLASDLGSGSVVEAGIDDVRIERRGCTTPEFHPADLNTTGTTNGQPDGTVNLSDLQFYLSTWQNDLGETPGSVADVNSTGSTNGQPDGTVNLSDLQYYLSIWSEGSMP